jgi:hypothetical protein
MKEPFRTGEPLHHSAARPAPQRVSSRVTRDEMAGLMRSLLARSGPPTGKTRPGDGLERHADKVGKRYAFEIERHDARRRS